MSDQTPSQRLNPLNRFALYCGIALTTVTGAHAQPITGDNTFEIGKESFLLNGKHFEIRCGEMHFARVPRDYWRHRVQMLKAMGMNAVCAYLFWNFHERTPGEFTWEDRADVAEFCKIAQEEGMWVVLRPGPYVCAEWEMGGLPWWLLKHEDIQLRSRDPRFMDASRKWLKEVGRVLGPMQVTKGGPILMVQVENEYGFYSNDAKYMGEMREAMLDAGFDVPLFACNPTGRLKNGYRDDLFPVVNFGSDPAKAFQELRKILPEGPLMSGEFYPGWFDTWGNPHHYGNTERYLKDVEYMLQHDASFSIYMAHGGSTFGMWAGADRPFKPDTSSYDYDAPLSEAGWTTPKFFKTRELVSRYLLDGEPPLPEPPAANPVKTYPTVEFNEYTSIFKTLPRPSTGSSFKTMEHYDQAKGCMIYRTMIEPSDTPRKLNFESVRDFAWVFLDGKFIDVMDRRSRKFSINLPRQDKPAQLDILVYAMGRVNFGKEVHDRKGLHAPATLQTGAGEKTQSNWQVFSLPLSDNMLNALKYEEVDGPQEYPGFWKGTLQVDTPADTFLNMRPWGKGVVWINGRCLGRFWNIGPTQSMYVPGPWLKEGSNEVIIMDLLGPESTELVTLEKPILDELRPELNFGGPRRPKVTLQLDQATPVHEGNFPQGSETQTVRFENHVTGSQFALQSLNAHDDSTFTTIAELDLLDARGESISHGDWTIAHVTSEERTKENGSAENAIDGQTSNFWHSTWSSQHPPHPHNLVIDLGKKETISGIRYVPRAGGNNTAGRIKNYKIFVGEQLVIPEKD